MGPEQSRMAEDADDPGKSDYVTERTTAPQSPYTQRDVLVGSVIALAGLVLTVGVPLLFA